MGHGRNKAARALHGLAQDVATEKRTTKRITEKGIDALGPELLAGGTVDTDQPLYLASQVQVTTNGTLELVGDLSILAGGQVVVSAGWVINENGSIHVRNYIQDIFDAPGTTLAVGATRTVPHNKGFVPQWFSVLYSDNLTDWFPTWGTNLAVSIDNTNIYVVNNTSNPHYLRVSVMG